nr:epoxyqueuosine reductase QueH [Treponema sp.]
LLLHACCGPCSSYVLEYLAEYFKITVLYYNPNIYPPKEYERRLEELKALYKKFPPVLQNDVKLVECDYNPDEFYEAVGTRQNHELANEPEKGERCRRCYEFRLKKTYDYAKAHNFDYFCTTLSISPFKDAEKLNVIGEELSTAKVPVETGAEKTSSKSELELGAAASHSPQWLPSDFKKKGGFKRSLEISAEYNLYRQEYCGCVYSMRTAVKENFESESSATANQKGECLK